MTTVTVTYNNYAGAPLCWHGSLHQAIGIARRRGLAGLMLRVQAALWRHATVAEYCDAHGRAIELAQHWADHLDVLIACGHTRANGAWRYAARGAATLCRDAAACGDTDLCEHAVRRCMQLHAAMGAVFSKRTYVIAMQLVRMRIMAGVDIDVHDDLLQLFQWCAARHVAVLQTRSSR